MSHDWPGHTSLKRVRQIVQLLNINSFYSFAYNFRLQLGHIIT